VISCEYRDFLSAIARDADDARAPANFEQPRQSIGPSDEDPSLSFLRNRNKGAPPRFPLPKRGET
jgi:hypothetical protein